MKLVNPVGILPLSAIDFASSLINPRTCICNIPSDNHNTAFQYGGTTCGICNSTCAPGNEENYTANKTSSRERQASGI